MKTFNLLFICIHIFIWFEQHSCAQNLILSVLKDTSGGNQGIQMLDIKHE